MLDVNARFCKQLVRGSTVLLFFFSSRRRHTRFDCDWSSDVCSSDLKQREEDPRGRAGSFGGGGRHVSSSLFEPTLTVIACEAKPSGVSRDGGPYSRSEERRVGKECRSRWSPYH